MINSFDLKKAKKMLNIPFGYTLLTGIRADGLEKIVSMLSSQLAVTVRSCLTGT